MSLPTGSFPVAQTTTSPPGVIPETKKKIRWIRAESGRGFDAPRYLLTEQPLELIANAAARTALALPRQLVLDAAAQLLDAAGLTANEHAGAGGLEFHLKLIGLAGDHHVADASGAFSIVDLSRDCSHAFRPSARIS